MAPVTPSPCRGLAGLGGRALLSGEPDDRLVALVRAGDERALAVLVERYRQPLLRHCRRFVSASRAEDAVQQSFINAHAALMRDGPPEALRPWLHRIAQNAALNIARDRQTHMDELPEGLGGGLRTEEAVEGRDALDRLVVALKALPAAQREVIVRHELEGHSHEMIAADLGITAGAARQLAFRARSMVRNATTAVTPVGLLRRLPWIDTAAGGAEAVTGAAAGGAVLTKLAAAVMAAGAVAGGDGVRLSNAKYPAQVMLIAFGQLRIGQRIDENVRGRTAQHRVHEKADLMRENSPCSLLPTASPRDSAYFVRSSVSNSLSLLGTCTLTRTRKSPRPRPCRR